MTFFQDEFAAANHPGAPRNFWSDVPGLVD
jgi:hypothetical protein